MISRPRNFQRLALSDAHRIALELADRDGVRSKCVLLEECDGTARWITYNPELSAGAVIRNVSGCSQRGNEVDRSASFAQYTHINWHKWLPQMLTAYSELRSRTMVVTEEERSDASSAHTREVRIVGLFHVPAAPTDETTMWLWSHFEEAVLFDAIAAAQGLLCLSCRSSSIQVHRNPQC